MLLTGETWLGVSVLLSGMALRVGCRLKAVLQIKLKPSNKTSRKGAKAQIKTTTILESGHLCALVLNLPFLFLYKFYAEALWIVNNLSWLGFDSLSRLPSNRRNLRHRIIVLFSRDHDPAYGSNPNSNTAEGGCATFGEAWL